MRNLPAMIEIDDIKDRESLVTLLEELPQGAEEDRAERRRIALTIAWRAAACGVPAFWRWVREHANPQVEADVVLPLLRSIIVTSYASMCDRAHFKMVRELAVTASGEAERIAKSASQAEAPVSVSNAAFAAAYATDAVAMGVNMKAVAASFDAAGFFTDGLPKPISLHGALLSSEFNEVFEDWAWIKKNLKNHDGEQGSATDWSFWIWWYDGLLNGTAPAPDSQMMQDIALLPDRVWQDVDTANAQINEIWRAYTSEALTRGEIVTYDETRDQFTIASVDSDDPDRLAYSLGRLNELKELVEISGNLSGALRGEIFLITNAANMHASNPVMVWNNTQTALDLLYRNIAAGNCPSAQAEPIVGLLETGLIDVAVQLSSDPKVRALAALPVKEVVDVSPELAEVLDLAAFAVSETLDEAHASETRDVAKIMRDLGQNKIMRLWAATRTACRVMGVWLAARYQNFQSLLDAAQTTSEKVKVITVNLSKIGATGAGAVGAISAVLNSIRSLPQFRQ